jgi:hypothetical protein
MADILNHAITVGDVLMAWGIAAALVLAVVAYAIISINMGWHR